MKKEKLERLVERITPRIRVAAAYGELVVLSVYIGDDDQTIWVDVEEKSDEIPVRT